MAWNWTRSPRLPEALSMNSCTICQPCLSQNSCNWSVWLRMSWPLSLVLTRLYRATRTAFRPVMHPQHAPKVRQSQEKSCTETAVFVQSIRHRVSSSVFVPGDSDCREGFCAVSHDCAVDQEHEAPLPLPAAITSAKER